MTDSTLGGFTATHFRFEVQALTPLAFEEYSGSALRGALVSALQRNFCPARDQADAAHQAICPVCWLLSHEATPGDSRRPYAVEPLLPGPVGRPARAEARADGPVGRLAGAEVEADGPVGRPARAEAGADGSVGRPARDEDGAGFWFEPGDRFRFGLTLFGQAVNLFPYLVLAVPQIGASGLGRKQPDAGGRWQRGRFKLCRIEEVNPLSGERLTLMGEGEQMVQTPRQPVTVQQTAATAALLRQNLAQNGGRLAIHFLTPTRIVREKRLVHRPEFRPLFQRLLERVHELQRTFGGGAPEIDWQGLLALADEVELVEDQTAWWDLQGHSSRLQREQQIGGFIGHAVYRTADETWAALLPWLVWGMSTHVGKNAVKGSGWYSLALGDRVTS